MMRRGYGSLLALLVPLLALSIAPAPSHAQAPYDTPTITSVDQGFFRIRLQVQAGTSGTPEGFVVQWMTKADFDLIGGWPQYDYDPRQANCNFYGTPTMNVDPRSVTYQLSPSGVTTIEIGDLFDETGCEATYGDGLSPGSPYVFRAYASSASGKQSPYTGNLFSTTTGSNECTQGFWKNHPEAWPASCTPMLLGTVSYTKTQLLSIYNTPAAGNGLIFLAHQLITTKLNICNGSDASSISATVSAADALIGGLVVPPIGGGFIAPSSASGLTATLDDYNNGKSGGVSNCPTAVQSSSWGRVKTTYR